jgi:hypothetical protein
MQYVSSCLELLPAGAAPPKDLWELFTAAARGDSYTVMVGWLQTNPAQTPHLIWLDHGPYYAVGESSDVVQYMLAMMLFRLCTPVLQQLPGNTVAAAAPAAAAAAATVASAAQQQGELLSSSSSMHNSNSSSSSTPDTAAAAAEGTTHNAVDYASSTCAGQSSGSSSNSSSNSGSGSSSNLNGCAELQQACAAAPHVPRCFRRLASSLGISDMTALWAAALSRKSHFAEVWGLPELCAWMLHKMSDTVMRNEADRIVLLITACLHWVLQLLPTHSTADLSTLSTFLGVLGLALRWQVHLLCDMQHAEGGDAGCEPAHSSQQTGILCAEQQTLQVPGAPNPAAVPAATATAATAATAAAAAAAAAAVLKRIPAKLQRALKCLQQLLQAQQQQQLLQAHKEQEQLFQAQQQQQQQLFQAYQQQSQQCFDRQQEQEQQLFLGQQAKHAEELVKVLLQLQASDIDHAQARMQQWQHEQGRFQVQKQQQDVWDAQCRLQKLFKAQQRQQQQLFQEQQQAQLAEAQQRWQQQQERLLQASKQHQGTAGSVAAAARALGALLGASQAAWDDCLKAVGFMLWAVTRWLTL